jgi:hypothetical protein
VILVTAQFREQNLQDTPIAITAVSAAMLEARSQTSIQDVANQAPSVTLKQQGATFGPSLGASIRGVGQFDFNPAVEPGVGLYVDDVYFATLTGSILDLLDLDRVEILRGPQGTLAGATPSAARSSSTRRGRPVTGAAIFPRPTAAVTGSTCAGAPISISPKTSTCALPVSRRSNRVTWTGSISVVSIPRAVLPPSSTAPAPPFR